MAIVASDIKYRLSIKSGASGSSAPQPDPNASLGKYVSTTELSSTALNNLFDNVSGSENAAGAIDYRCIFVHNTHATLTLQSAVVYMSAEVPGGTSIAIATDNIAASASNSGPAQATSITDETTAPTGVSAFSSPTTAGAGLSLGSLAPGQVKAVWIRRTANNTSALNADGVTLTVTGDTAA